LDDSEHASSSARLADVDAEALPLQSSFIRATTVALVEMASTEVAVQHVYRGTLDMPWGDISAAVAIRSVTDGLFVLSFPAGTAAAIAERVLADAKAKMNQSLVEDCVGEIANVIAGQAKTLLAGTPYQLTFSLPEVVVGNHPKSHLARSCGCLIIVFRSDLGEFSLGLALERWRSLEVLH
jgi:chemotaxis protein CheX